MKKFKNVIITDLSEYDGDRCNNGGCYSFTDEFCYNENLNTYQKFYSTSADFEYCYICGGFQSCSQCGMYDREEGECISKPDTATWEEIEKIIQEHKDKGSYMYEEGDTLYIEFGEEEEEE